MIALIGLSISLLWRADIASPELVRGYAESVVRIQQRQTRDDSVVAPGGRSLLMTHGARASRVFVFLHGFTDSPEQFAAVGQALFGRGDNVFIPRLPHHAEREQALRSLAKVRAAQLEAFGDSVVDEAAGLGDTVVVIGLSAGGVIAGHIAQSRTDVGRVVLISPAIAAEYLDDRTGTQIVRAAARLPEVRRQSAPDSAGPEFKQGITSRGLGQLLRLGAKVRDDAGKSPPRVKQIVFLLNDGDHTVSENAAMDVARSWSAHGADVSVYSFSKMSKLPHNVMADDRHDGNTHLVYPVIDAIARGAEIPASARPQALDCNSFRCLLKKAATKI